MSRNYKIIAYLLGAIFVVAIGSACSEEIPEADAAVAALKEMLTAARAEVEVMTVDQLAATLKRLGFTEVYYLDGGFEAWAHGGYSIYNPHGELQVLQYEKAESADTTEPGEKQL